MIHCSPSIPTHYLAWRECITIHCEIPLTAEYVAQRLAVLTQTDHEETRRFRGAYGDEHWQRVIAWFRQAGRELASSEA